MGNKLIAALLLAVPVVAHAACDRPVDQKKVVLFLDMNMGEAEVAAAERAACEKGQRLFAFSTYPGAYRKKSFPGTVKPIVEQLAAQDAAITTVILSGHAGGGFFMGPNGRIRKEEVINIIKDAYRSKPHLLSQWNLALMWGCYSAVPEEAVDWRESLPSLKILGGFYDSAPSSRQPIDRSILHDLMTKGSRTLQVGCEPSRVKQAIEGVTNYGQTAASIFVKPSCNPGGFLYYQDGPRHNFETLDAASTCTASDRAVVDLQRRIVQKYFSGQVPVPADTSKGELRLAYTRSRQYEHCLSSNDFYMTPDRIGALLFWNGVRFNFNANFRNEMGAGQNTLNGLRVNVNLSANLRDFGAKLLDAKRSVGTTGISGMHDLPRQQVALNLAKLSPLINHPALRESAQLKNLMGPLIRAYRLGDSYLYKLDPNCMDFLTWHDWNPANPAPPLCRY